MRLSFFLLFACCAYLAAVEENNLRFRQLTVEDGLPQNGVLGITQDKYGFMWFGTWNGLCRYDGYNFTVFHPSEHDSTSVVSNLIISVYKDPAGDIWVGFANGEYVCRYNYELNNFSRFHYRNIDTKLIDSLNRYKPFVKSIAHAGNHRWEVVYPAYRLVQHNSSNHNSLVYKPGWSNRWALNSEFVGEIYLDENKILWVATSGSGVNYADTRQKAFHLYRSPSFPNDIRAICKDLNGNIWVGTRSNGIGLLNKRDNSIVQHAVVKYDFVGENSFNQIRSLFCDRHGFIWIGTKAGLRRFNPLDNSYRDYTVYTNSPVPHNWIFEIMEDHNGDLWIGTFKGIAKYNRNDDRFMFFDSQKFLSSPKVRAIKEDREHNLWVATEEGGLTCLNRIDRATAGDEFVPLHFRHVPNDSSSISSDLIYSMDIDEKGNIWLATLNGLNVLDPKTRRFKCISDNNGLPEKIIKAVLCDRNGYAWVSHMKGLSRIDINTFHVTSYTYEDGLQDKDFLESSCFRDNTTGELFFGGTNGLNLFSPDKIRDNKIAPRVYVTGLKILNKNVQINEVVNGRVVLDKAIYLTDKLTLNHLDRTIELNFSGLHFSNPSGNMYRYMLEGFDDAWIFTDASKRAATYSNLDPGRYTFKVFAANPDGVWCDKPATIAIVVLPPWWLSWAAYVAYFILVLMVLYGIIRIIKAQEKYRHQIVFERLKADKLKEFDDLKSNFFTNMAHELRTPLSLIIDPLEKIIADASLTESSRYYFLVMQKNAKRLYKITNQLLDFRKLETGRLELVKSVNDIVDHIGKIFESFQTQAAHRNIQYGFHADENEIWVEYDVEKIETVIFNIISNAFKYTPDGGAIDVAVNSSDSPNAQRFLNIVVRDNGKGIKPEALKNIFQMFFKENANVGSKSYGIGLAFSNELVQLHGGTISVESVEGKGATFNVSLPYTTVHLHPSGQNQSPDVNIELTAGEELFGDATLAPEDEKTSLLIIEDNDDIRNYLVRVLSSSYRVFDASNGVEGLSKAVDCLPDLVISDVMMPGIDGFELCKRLKADVRTSHIPVILLTARQSEQFIIEGYQTGADAYIIKPFNSSVLISRIENLIDSRSKLRALFGKSSFLDTKAIVNNVTDEAFINKTIKIIIDNIEDTNFSSESLSERLNMSRALLYKKIKSLTDLTVHNFITTVRLNKAAELLLSGDYNVSEVAYKVGYTVASNFSRSFTKQFGESPSNYLLKHREANKNL